MQTKSYISAAALAAALLITPQATLAQTLGLDVDLDILGIQTDADVDVGGDSLVDADVNVGTGDGSDSDAGTAATDSLVDIDVGTSPATGPNGGTLIDLNIGSTDEALVDADLDVLGSGSAAGGGSSLITGDIRLAALDQDARKDALLGRIDNPNLADIDLDAVIDDRRVAIIAAADLLGPDDLADIRAAITLGGDGRTELRDALSASVELGAILDNQGIDRDDVLAIEVADNGATAIIVLGGAVDIALLGDNGDVAELTAPDLANLDVDLLSREELAEVDLDLLPDDLRTTAQLRLLGSDSDDADLTPGELAAVDLDLLSQDELAELDVDLLPQPLAAAVNLRLLGDDGDLSEASVGDLSALDISLFSASDDGGGNGSGAGDGGTGPGATPAGSGDGTPGGGGDATDGDGDNAGSGTDTGGDASGDDTAGLDANGEPLAPPVIGTLPPVQVGAGFVIATLGCDVGTLALASGLEATPQAIAGADALELVRIDGCQRSLVDSEVDTIRAAITRNPVISDVLDDAEIPLDQVIGATIQDGTLTLFIEPTVS